MGLIACPKTLAINYQSMLHKIPEECRYLLHHSRSLKSSNFSILHTNTIQCSTKLQSRNSNRWYQTPCSLSAPETIFDFIKSLYIYNPFTQHKFLKNQGVTSKFLVSPQILRTAIQNLDFCTPIVFQIEL